MPAVPPELRQAIAEQLGALVRGDYPELLMWVARHGRSGARLGPQPEAIRTHDRTDVTPVRGGGWHVVVPLWTEEESPSDLSAEIHVTAGGVARIDAVHVL